jgi:hypothetical protein
MLNPLPKLRLLSRPVFAMLGIEAGIREYQTFDRLSPNDVRLDDLIYVRQRDSSVPHGVRIHDQIGTVLALIEAACLIGSNSSLQPKRRQLFFE